MSTLLYCPECDSEDCLCGRGLAGDGPALLDALVAFLWRFVIFASNAQAYAVALWVVHTHAIGAFNVAAYLYVSSPEPASGKTLLACDLLELVVANPWRVFEPSDAVFFRKIDRDHPTVLFDEIDSVFAKNGERLGLRSIFNAGHRRGSLVWRADDNGQTLRGFDPFCPKAFAGTIDLPDSTSSRTIPIRLQKKRHDERPERFRKRDVEPQAAPLHHAAELWADEHEAALRDARPPLPEELTDRQQDIWEPLIAIADAAGERWGERARAAAVELSGGTPSVESVGVLALRHIKDAFDEAKADRLMSSTLLDMLIDREDGPWAGWWAKEIQNNNRKGPASRLARILHPYDIEPRKVRFPIQDGKSTALQGYMSAWFEDAWKRYLPPDGSGPDDGTDGTDGAGSGSSPENDGTIEHRRSEAVLGSDARDPNVPSDQGSSNVPSLWGETRERAVEA